MTQDSLIVKVKQVGSKIRPFPWDSITVPLGITCKDILPRNNSRSVFSSTTSAHFCFEMCSYRWNSYLSQYFQMITQLCDTLVTFLCVTKVLYNCPTILLENEDCTGFTGSNQCFETIGTYRNWEWAVKVLIVVMSWMYFLQDIQVFFLHSSLFTVKMWIPIIAI